MVDLELRNKWIEELKSGNWKQANFYLSKKNGSYCCLGVACQLYMNKYEDGRWQSGESNRGYNYLDFGGGKSVEFMPGQIARALGLSRIQQEELASLNDDKGYNFEQIASEVESMAVYIPEESE